MRAANAPAYAPGGSGLHDDASSSSAVWIAFDVLEPLADVSEVSAVRHEMNVPTEDFAAACRLGLGPFAQCFEQVVIENTLLHQVGASLDFDRLFEARN